MSLINHDHHNFSMILNIVDDVLINPYERSLYMKLKRIAGEVGGCFKSNKALAKECGMGEVKLIATKKALAKPRPELGGRALITIEKRFSPKGDKMPDMITLNQFWAENDQYFKEKNRGTSPNVPPLLHETLYPGSRREDKEDYSYEVPYIKEEERVEGASTSDFLSPHDKQEIAESTKGVTHLLVNRLKGHFPEFKEPNMKKWYEVMDRIIRLDKKGVSDVSNMIEWAMNDEFWFKTIQSPTSLRKNWNTMYMQKEAAKNKSPLSKQKWAQEVVNKFVDSGIYITNDGLEFHSGIHVKYINFKDPDFKDHVLKRLKMMNLESGDL